MTEINTRTIRVEEAEGLTLAHDITEIRPGEYKGAAFRKGHKVQKSDLRHLMRLGKRHLYVLDITPDQVHEDDAVVEMVQALAGPGVCFGDRPREGKLQLTAACQGLFKAHVKSLIAFNLIKDVMCASIHTNTPVQKGGLLAGTRAIPLVIERKTLDHAVKIARKHGPIFSVKAFKPMSAGLVITGNEVYEGLIEDKFENIVRDKFIHYGATVAATHIVPDNKTVISETISALSAQGVDMIVTTGGMSVDPDDVTRLGIRDAGADPMYYGAGVLPGAMGLLAYRGDMPIIGIPACALYHEATVFDLLLPRLLTGEKPDGDDMAAYAHGGLCLDCATCRFPACSFGKNG